MSPGQPIPAHSRTDAWTWTRSAARAIPKPATAFSTSLAAGLLSLFPCAKYLFQSDGSRVLRSPIGTLQASCPASPSHVPVTYKVIVFVPPGLLSNALLPGENPCLVSDMSPRSTTSRSSSSSPRPARRVPGQPKSTRQQYSGMSSPWHYWIPSISQRAAQHAAHVECEGQYILPRVTGERVATSAITEFDAT